MEVKCDQCSQVFNLNDLDTNLVEDLPNRIERCYFECPSCKKQYTTHYRNDIIRELQREIKSLQNKPTLKIKQKNKLNTLRQVIVKEHEALMQYMVQGENNAEAKETM